MRRYWLYKSQHLCLAKKASSEGAVALINNKNIQPDTLEEGSVVSNAEVGVSIIV